MIQMHNTGQVLQQQLQLYTRLPDNMFKKRTGHRRAERVEGKGEWEGGMPSLVHQEIRRSIVALSAGSGQKFIKCCVTELIK